MVKNYLSLIKFSHTIFALPFALIGYFLAIEFSAYSFDWTLLAKVVLCMVFARSAAMAFNRYIDRDIDKANSRTADVREIPKGVIKPKSALIFVFINSLLFIATTFFINPLCFWLSPIALGVILGYSYTKRFTALCHLILGIGLSLAPIGAYLSVTSSFAWLPLYYSFAVLFWVAGFDLIYSLQDADFDKHMNLHSIPSALGAKNALALAKFFHLISIAFILFATYRAEGNWLYWIGSIVFTILLVFQHSLIRVDDLSKVNLAFFTTNGIASLVYAILLIASFYI